MICWYFQSSFYFLHIFNIHLLYYLSKLQYLKSCSIVFFFSCWLVYDGLFLKVVGVWWFLAVGAYSLKHFSGKSLRPNLNFHFPVRICLLFPLSCRHYQSGSTIKHKVRLWFFFGPYNNLNPSCKLTRASLQLSFLDIFLPSMQRQNCIRSVSLLFFSTQRADLSCILTPRV